MQTLKVLIVDDDVADRLIYKDFLTGYSDFKFEFAEANNAKKGLELFEKFHPDCIIIDYMMPEVNGLELIRNIKQKCEKQPPIFMLSGSHDKNLEKQAMDIGAVHYLSKNDMFPGKLQMSVIETVVKAKIAGN